MAERKPLFQSAEGFFEQMATTDSATFGSLTLGGNIDMQSTGKIVNHPAPAVDGDVVNKLYVDQQVTQGRTWKEALLHENQLDDTDGVNAAVALTLQNQAANDDRVVLTDGSTTRTYYFGTGTGDVQVTIGASIAESMQNLATAIQGDGSSIWGAYYVTDLDAIDSDGVVVIIEDANSGTAPEIYGTNWDAGDCQIVDFGDELDYTSKTLEDIPSSDPASTNFGFRRTQASLVDGETHVALHNDTLYVWDDSSNAWQTASGSGTVPDATGASGGGVKGKATYDTDYGLAVTSGIVTINVTASAGLKFNGGTGALEVEPNDFAGTGLEDDGADNLRLATQGNGIAGGAGSTLSVDPDSETGGDIQAVNVTANGVGLDISAIAGDGLVADGSANLDVNLETSNPSLQIVGDELGVKLSDGLTKDANGTAVNLDASGSGLEFTGAAGDGTLGIKLEASNPTLEVDGSNQLKVKYGATTSGLTQDANGLKANVDGTSITINGSGQLVAGDVTEADRIENTLTTATDTVAVADPVYVNGDETMGKARADDNTKAHVIGIIRSGSGAAPQSIEVVSIGPCAGILTGATPGDIYYLGATGGITTTAPGGGNRIIVLGYAYSDTDLWVQIKDFGKKAA